VAAISPLHGERGSAGAGDKGVDQGRQHILIAQHRCEMLQADVGPAIPVDNRVAAGQCTEQQHRDGIDHQKSQHGEQAGAP